MAAANCGSKAARAAIPDRGPGFLLQANADKLLGEVRPGGLTLRLQRQASAVYGLNDKLQLGARIGFENSRLREQAFIIGLWRTF
jgi:hypothetical protein